MLAVGATWRVTGVAPAGRALVSGLVEGDEAERAVAGIALTKAGDRSVPLLAEALTGTADPRPVVDVLASIATPAARRALRQAAEAGSPAAAQALRTLDDIDGL